MHASFPESHAQVACNQRLRARPIPVVRPPRSPAIALTIPPPRGAPARGGPCPFPAVATSASHIPTVSGQSGRSARRDPCPEIYVGRFSTSDAYELFALRTVSRRKPQQSYDASRASQHRLYRCDHGPGTESAAYADESTQHRGNTDGRLGHDHHCLPGARASGR